MYILLSAIVTLLIGFYAEINISAALGQNTQFATILTIVVMGCFILYDNKRKHK